MKYWTIFIIPFISKQFFYQSIEKNILMNGKKSGCELVFFVVNSVKESGDIYFIVETRKFRIRYFR